MTTSVKTQIAKLALSLLKGGNITSIDPPDEGSKEARVMALWFDPARKAALAAHNWDFARKRVEIAKDSVSPAFEFDNRFLMPADLVRLVRIGEDWDNPVTEFEIESGYILANEDGPLPVVYIWDQTDVTKFTPLFVEYMAHILAAMACYDITGAKDMIQPMYGLAGEKLASAQSLNMQQRPPRRIQRSKLKTARMGNTRIDADRWGD